MYALRTTGLIEALVRTTNDPPDLSTASRCPGSECPRSANGKSPHRVSGDGKCGRSAAVSAVNVTCSTDSSGKLIVTCRSTAAGFCLLNRPGYCS